MNALKYVPGMQLERWDLKHPIESQSYAVINENFDATRYSGLEAEIAKRIVHATADFELGHSLLFSPKAIEIGIDALEKGCVVTCDVEMVRAGITKYPTNCYLNAVTSSPTGFPTRSYSAMAKAAELNPENGLFVIGCAPTALAALVELENASWFNPALIIGLPVGFIGAAETKNLLVQSRFNFITNQGNKGGSPAASAAMNALLRLREIPGA